MNILIIKRLRIFIINIRTCCHNSTNHYEDFLISKVARQRKLIKFSKHILCTEEENYYLLVKRDF